MVDGKTRDLSANQPKLVLSIQNNAPLPAAELGTFLTSLASDYKRLNPGRTLVIVQLETGSLIAWLQEILVAGAPYVQAALDSVKLAIRLKEFVQKLKSLVKEENETADTPSKMGDPAKLRSVERLAEVLAKTNGEASISYKSPQGEEIIMKMTSAEAIKIRQQAKLTRAKIKVRGATLVSRPNEVALNPTVMADRIEALYTTNGNVQTLVETFASTLHSAGFGHLLEDVATDLSNRGHLKLAEIVRGSTRGHKKNQNPPLLR